jgi:hypothetical protein
MLVRSSNLSSIFFIFSILVLPSFAQTGAELLPPSAFDKPNPTPFEIAKSDDLYWMEGGEPQIQQSSWVFFPSPSSVGRTLQVDGRVHVVPKTLMAHAQDRQRYALSKTTEKEVLDRLWPRLKKKGYDENSIRNASAKTLLKLSMEITVEALTPADVDRIYEIGTHSILFYFDIGQGDCDKYRDLSMAFFYTLKNWAGNRENFFVLDQEFGSFNLMPIWNYEKKHGPSGEFSSHTWLSVVSLGSNGVWHVTHLDPTWVDSKSQYFYAANDSDHIDPELFRYYFFQAIGSPRGVVAEFLNDDLEGNRVQISEKLGIVVDSLYRLGWIDSLWALNSAFYGGHPGITNDTALIYMMDVMKRSWRLRIADRISIFNVVGLRLLEDLKDERWEKVRKTILGDYFNPKKSYFDETQLKIVGSYPHPTAKKIVDEYWKKEFRDRYYRRR